MAAKKFFATLTLLSVLIGSSPSGSNRIVLDPIRVSFHGGETVQKRRHIHALDVAAAPDGAEARSPSTCRAAARVELFELHAQVAFTSSDIRSEASSLLHSVAGGSSVLCTRAPSRDLDLRLNEGWKALTHSREALHSGASARVAGTPESRQ